MYEKDQSIKTTILFTESNPEKISQKLLILEEQNNVLNKASQTPNVVCLQKPNHNGKNPHNIKSSFFVPQNPLSFMLFRLPPPCNFWLPTAKTAYCILQPYRIIRQNAPNKNALTQHFGLLHLATKSNKLSPSHQAKNYPKLSLHNLHYKTADISHHTTKAVVIM